jgi:hypothetical protein
VAGVLSSLAFWSRRACESVAQASSRRRMHDTTPAGISTGTACSVSAGGVSRSSGERLATAFADALACAARAAASAVWSEHPTATRVGAFR